MGGGSKQTFAKSVYKCKLSEHISVALQQSVLCLILCLVVQFSSSHLQRNLTSSLKYTACLIHFG